MFSVHSKQYPVRFKVSGRLDTNSSHEFNKVIQPLLEKEKFLIIDMSECSYLSSSGIRQLLSATKKLKSKGGNLYLAGLVPLVCQVIEMTGLHKVFKIVGSVEDAVNTILKLEKDAPSQINQFLPEGQIKIVYQREKESPAYFWAKETIAGFDELGISIGVGCPSEMYGSDEPVSGLFVTVHNCAGFIPFDEGFPADYRIP
ncbi:MAG: STAS domain-containing protein, partial [Prolixibacteraceae bacterium]|nr:STAS domain-containing protein [Prolixibacteraceae bacterium]